MESFLGRGRVSAGGSGQERRETVLGGASLRGRRVRRRVPGTARHRSGSAGGTGLGTGREGQRARGTGDVPHTARVWTARACSLSRRTRIGRERDRAPLLTQQSPCTYSTQPTLLRLLSPSLRSSQPAPPSPPCPCPPCPQSSSTQWHRTSTPPPSSPSHAPRPPSTPSPAASSTATSPSPPSHTTSSSSPSATHPPDALSPPSASRRLSVQSPSSSQSHPVPAPVPIPISIPIALCPSPFYPSHLSICVVPRARRGSGRSPPLAHRPPPARRVAVSTLHTYTTRLVEIFHISFFFSSLYFGSARV